MSEPQVEVTGGGQVYSTDRARVDLLQPDRPGEHVWMITVVHRVTPETIEKLERRDAILDAENIAMVMTGCFVCERVYEKRLTYRKCPGEPR